MNGLLEAGPQARLASRRRVSALLDAKSAEANAARRVAERVSRDPAGCAMHLPARAGNFTGFFAGIYHARTAGTISRPDNPLTSNHNYVPVAYHSRASSVRVSGGTVRRPDSQRKPPAQAEPDFGPGRALDYELEPGVWIGLGNASGVPIPIAEAGDRIAGVWSVPRQRQRVVLDPGANGRAPHVKRVRPASGRFVRQRYGIG